MLIDFTVENYRSIKGPVTLSAIAQTGRASERIGTRAYVKADAEIAPTYPVEGRGFELLPVLAIFGANASGKSNVLLALDKLLDLMANENSAVRSFPFTILDGISPFRLSKVTADSPTQSTFILLR